MNVWVVSFDESQDASDPLLRAFSTRPLAERAVRQMVAGTPFEGGMNYNLEEYPSGSFHYSVYESDEDEWLRISLFEVPVESAETVTAKGVL